MWLKYVLVFIVSVSTVSANQRLERWTISGAPGSAGASLRVVRSAEDPLCSDLDEVCPADCCEVCGARKSRQASFSAPFTSEDGLGEIRDSKFVRSSRPSRNERSAQMDTVQAQQGEEDFVILQDSSNHNIEQRAANGLAVPEVNHASVPGKSPHLQDSNSENILKLMSSLQTQDINSNIDQQKHPMFDQNLESLKGVLAQLQKEFKPPTGGDLDHQFPGNLPQGYNFDPSKLIPQEQPPELSGFAIPAEFQNPPINLPQNLNNGMQFIPPLNPDPLFAGNMLTIPDGFDPKMLENVPNLGMNNFPPNVPNDPDSFIKQVQIPNDGIKPNPDQSRPFEDLKTPPCPYCEMLKKSKLVQEPMRAEDFKKMMSGRTYRQAPQYFAHPKYKREADVSFTEEEDCPNGDDQVKTDKDNVKMHPSLKDQNTNQASKDSSLPTDRITVKVISFDGNNESSFDSPSNKEPEFKVPQKTLLDQRVSFSVHDDSEDQDMSTSYPDGVIPPFSSSSDIPESLLDLPKDVPVEVTRTLVTSSLPSPSDFPEPLLDQPREIPVAVISASATSSSSDTPEPLDQPEYIPVMGTKTLVTPSSSSSSDAPEPLLDMQMDVPETVVTPVTTSEEETTFTPLSTDHQEAEEVPDKPATKDTSM